MSDTGVLEGDVSRTPPGGTPDPGTLGDVTRAPAPGPYPVVARPPAPGAPGPNADAMAIIHFYLDQFGLGELAQWAYDQGVVESGVLNEDRLLILLQQQDAYKRRFVGNDIRRQNGYSVLTPFDYLAVENSMRGLMQSAQLPVGFYDQPDDFAQWIGRNVSPTELGQRITDGYLAAAQADPTVRQQLLQFYGIDEGGLAAYYLDPNRAVSSLMRQASAARVGSASIRTGFGQLSLTEAEGLAGLGVTEPGAEQGFNQLTGERELFTPINQGEDVITREEQLGAAFQGSAAAQQRIRRRQSQRLAEFQGGGQFAATREGLGGLGSTVR